MKRTNVIGGLLAGLGTAGLALGAPAVAGAQQTAATYTANLQPVPLNTPAGAASGNLTLVLKGNRATISESVQGLGATFDGKPFPHVQHIHGNGAGVCPTAAADTSHDGVISTPEGIPAYGSVLTTLSVKGGTTPAQATDTGIAPTGASFTYHRTITLDAATLASIEKGTAVVVVHGLNPANAPANALKEKSPLVPALPLAATAPALCGTLVASQMSTVPAGAPQTGGGSTAGLQDTGLLAAGGAMLLGGTGLLAYRRRRTA
ncbi:MAG TPA: hypothetical protein VFN50_07020 [Acidimicrobiales bacterium]|nr:hypothetical protein [Acidimicrobiales bacterium]